MGWWDNHTPLGKMARRWLYRGAVDCRNLAFRLMLVAETEYATVSAFGQALIAAAFEPKRLAGENDSHLPFLPLHKLLLMNSFNRIQNMSSKCPWFFRKSRHFECSEEHPKIHDSEAVVLT